MSEYIDPCSRPITRFCGSWWNQSWAWLTLVAPRELDAGIAHSATGGAYVCKVCGASRMLSDPPRIVGLPSQVASLLGVRLVDVAETDDRAVLLREEVHDQVLGDDLTVLRELDRRGDAL